MMVDGGQLAVCWHVGNLKISYRDEAIVSEFTEAMAKEFVTKTTILRGKVYDYLGVDLDSDTCAGTMIISMIKYLRKIIDEFPEVFRGTKACPAGDILYKVQEGEDRKLLTGETTNQFHQTTTQLLFL